MTEWSVFRCGGIKLKCGRKVIKAPPTMHRLGIQAIPLEPKDTIAATSKHIPSTRGNL